MKTLNSNFRLQTEGYYSVTGNRMIWVILLAGILLTSNVVFAAEYTVDQSKSKFSWEAKKVTGKHEGTIMIKEGTITLSGTKLIGGSFVMDMNSIANTDITSEDMNKKLIGHLKSEDFFSVEKYPEAKLVITKITQMKGGESEVTGDLTIKGVTKPILFKVMIDLSNKEVIANGMITINRTLFGIKYGSGSFFQGLGDKMIYDEFTLAFNVIAVKK